jgi:hypothetical protein
VQDSPKRSKIPVVNSSLNQQLNLYALAASAAGVGLLALAPPCEAKIVYTKTHHIVGSNSIFPLDLNHDGTIDFVIQEWRMGSSSATSGNNGLWVKEAFGNAVEGGKSKGGPPLASALRKGALIGAGKPFINTTSAYGELMVSAGCSD